MNIAYIPVRGGSKSIPLKNIKNLCGRPLVYWVVKAAGECKDIDVIYVATDSEVIKRTVEEFFFNKVKVIERSKESASDTASTEMAMLEFSSQYSFDNIVLIQATSPMLTAEDLTRGFEKFQEKDTDSVLSVVRQKRFNWEEDEEGYAKASNYDIFHRPRRQEFDGYLVENGAFYITSRAALLKYRNRVSGRIRAVEMSENSFLEIDENMDWEVTEYLLRKREKEQKLLAKKSEIRMFLTDCDGCLTDGGMYYSEKGDEMKKFHTRDGMGFQRLREKGIITGIVTGEDMALNRKRAEKLKLDFIRSGIKNKVDTIRDLCREYDILLENVVYVGDDLNDLDAIRLVGFGCCVQNAVDELKKEAKYIARLKGGEGAVREIIDYILSDKYM